MSEIKKILLGANPKGEQQFLLAKMANRHGLVAGATGTGKTVSLQVLTEGFSRLGVPVFTADVKGDLSGLASAGSPHEKIDERVRKISIDDYKQRPYPTNFWDIYGKRGLQIRTTVSEFGPVLFSNLLELNETQEGVLHIAFSMADDEGLLLLDMKDLRSLLTWMSDNNDDLQAEYGNLDKRSIAAIQRRLHVLEEQGGDIFFGEPALDIKHFIQKDFSGAGVVNILDATKLIANPRLYSTFLLWLLSELFEELDEVGDEELPKLVFFFDEAHLLFSDAPKALIEKLEQVVRLIRSKGVGIFFVTQHPLDIPDSVLGQLGNRVQHALRAFTPRDKKAVKTAAETFRANPELDTQTLITELGVGECLLSVLDEKGQPTVVEQTLVCPPESKMGPSPDEILKERIASSPFCVIYSQSVDRESAYELLLKRAEEKKKADEKLAREQEKEAEKKKSSRRQSATEAFFKSMVRTVGRQIGSQIVRGVLGSIGLGRGRR